MAENFNIFPIPQKIEIKDGYFNLGRHVTIYLENTSKDKNVGLDIFLEKLQSIGVEKVSYVSIDIGPQIIIAVDNTNLNYFKPKTDSNDFVFSPDMIKEGYIINIDPKRIILLSKTQRGLYYGLLTLAQIIGQFKGKIRCCKIEDFPDFSWRAVSDDISRGQVSTVENFKKIIRQLSFLKYNKYMLYMEDVFKFKNFPDIGKGRGALTADEIDEIERYANKYFVDIVPIFQTVGHYENILTQNKYIKYAEYPGAASINISSRKAINFVLKLLDEVTDAFDSEYFHMGADESWDVGLGASEEYINRVGFEKAYGEYYAKIYDYLKNKGKKVLMYGDVLIHHPEIFKYLPEDIIIVDWNYNLIDRYSSLDVFTENNRKYIVCAGLYNWLNPVPNFYYAWLNISNYFSQAHQKRAEGAIVSSWGDYGSPNLREQNYLGYFYGAQVMWNGREADFMKINRQFANHFLGISKDSDEINHLVLFLSQIPQLSNFPYIWSYPFYKHEPDMFLKSEILETISKNSKQIIDSLKRECILNNDYLDYLEIGYDFAEYSSRKMKVSIGIDNILRIIGNGKKPKDELINSLINDITEATRYLQRLKEKFVSLWLKGNRKDNLDLIISLFDRQKTYMEYAVSELNKNEFNVKRELESKWITCDTSKIKDPKSPVLFLNNFNAGKLVDIERVDLQVIANTYAEVFVNLRQVATVFATKSLSLRVENMKVWWSDIKKYIKSGDNSIILRVRSYKPEFPASANVYIRIKYANGDEKIVITDETWKFAVSSIENIKRINKIINWYNVLLFRDYPWKISPPLFDYGFPSMIEF